MIKRLSLGTIILTLAEVVSAFMVSSFASDAIKGTYWNAEKTAHIRMYKARNGKYYGKVEHLEIPNDKNGKPKTDDKNPNEELRSRSRLGMVIAKAFTWDEEEQEWNDGNIYNPEDGKTYDGYMYFKEGDKDKLYLRGFV